MKSTLRIVENTPTSKLRKIGPNSGLDRIALILADATHIIRQSDIEYCQASSNYCKVALLNGKSLLISKPLKTLASALSKTQFIRVHQSYLVNTSRITEIRRENLLLHSGAELPIARSRRTYVHETIQAACIII